MQAGPIFLIIGSPGSGKTTLSQALMRRFHRGLHLPLDDLREWVASGIAHPIEWTDETSRQFALALDAALDVAVRYSEAGFAVTLDHCHHVPYLNAALAARGLFGRVRKVLLRPGVEACLERNRSRASKSFYHRILVPIIQALCAEFDGFTSELDGWIVMDTRFQSVEESVDALLAVCPEFGTLGQWSP